MRKIGLWKSLLLGLVMAAGILGVNRLDTRAAAMPEMKSKGRIAWDNGTSDKSDDITVFDSKDIQYLYELADPSNDILWRKEESGIVSGTFKVISGDKVASIPRNTLQSIESYIKELRKAYEENGDIFYPHYSNFGGKITGESYDITKSTTKNSVSIIDIFDKLSYYADETNPQYQNSQPLSSYNKRAVNSGYVRIEGNGGSTGQIRCLGYVDYYETANPHKLAFSSFEPNILGTDTLKIYEDINFSYRGTVKKDKFTFDDIDCNFPAMGRIKGSLSNYGEEVKAIISKAQKDYSEVEEKNSEENCLIKVSKIEFPSTCFSDFPLYSEYVLPNNSKPVQERVVSIETNVSYIPGYEKLTKYDFLLPQVYFKYGNFTYGVKNYLIEFPHYNTVNEASTVKTQYDRNTGDLKFEFLLYIEGIKPSDIEKYTFDGAFDLYLNVSPSTYDILQPVFSPNNDLEPGIYDGFGQRIYSWDELANKGLDWSRQTDAGSTLLSFAKEDGNISLYNVIVPPEQKIIGAGIFKNVSYLSSVNIPEGVESIGNSAFEQCTLLKKVKFPDSLKKIGESAFKNSGLSNVDFGIGIEELGKAAFYQTVLRDFDLKNTQLTKIGSNCFYTRTNKRTVTLPDTLVEIGSYAFSSPNTTAFEKGSVAEVHIPSSVKKLQSNCFNSPSFCYTSFYFEDGFNGDADNVWNYEDGYADIHLPNDITRIGNYIACNAAYFEIPESVTELGKAALYGYYGDSVNISNVIKLGEACFKNATNIVEVTLPPSLKSVGKSLFSGCSSLQRVNYDGIKLKSVPDSWFSGCISIESPMEVLTDDVQSLGNNVFYGCAFRNLEPSDFPASLTSIGEGIFLYNKQLEYVELPDNIVFYQGSANLFNGCTSLKKVILPSGIDCLGNSMFKNCSSLEEVQIPDGLTKIGNYCFDSCLSLKELELPGELMTIGEMAFYECTSLNITVPMNVEIKIAVNRPEDEKLYVFKDVLNVNYDGTDTYAPWGAKSFNGVPQ